MGLLNYLTATSLDEDYAHVAERRVSSRRPGRTALAVLAAFGVLVATAAVETARTADDAQVRHNELVKQVIAHKERLASRRERAEDLLRETQALQTAFLQATAQGRSVQAKLTELGLVAGAHAARGPGVRVVVDDGPATSGQDAHVLDVDLQKLVNGLWLAGAEAIAINGQRLTSLTAIKMGGDVMTVNFKKISPPYTVSAIGDPGALPAGFVDTPGGQWWLDLQALYGLRFEINSVPDEEPLTLPAASRIAVRHAHVPEATLR